MCVPHERMTDGLGRAARHVIRLPVGLLELKQCPTITAACICFAVVGQAHSSASNAAASAALHATGTPVMCGSSTPNYRFGACLLRVFQSARLSPA